jgi:two-component sensor histidine kinase
MSALVDDPHSRQARPRFLRVGLVFGPRVLGGVISLMLLFCSLFSLIASLTYDGVIDRSSLAAASSGAFGAQATNVQFLADAATYSGIIGPTGDVGRIVPLGIIIGLALAVLALSLLLWREHCRATRTGSERDALAGKVAALQGELIKPVGRTGSSQSASTREGENATELVQAMGHRLGSALSTVSSLLALQALRAEGDDTRKALESARLRVHAVAAVHRRLTLADDFETASALDFLESVIDDVTIAAGDPKRIQVEAHIEPVLMSLRDATSVGLMVSELLTNAFEHAFPDGRTGLVRVSLSVGMDGVPVLAVSDDGIGAEERELHDAVGLGTVIVRQLTAPFGSQPVYTQAADGGLRVQVRLETLKHQTAPTAEEH